MTIKKAIEWLMGLQKKHGDDVLVYFDCPKCRESFAPSTVLTAAVHLQAETEKP